MSNYTRNLSPSPITPQINPLTPHSQNLNSLNTSLNIQTRFACKLSYSLSLDDHHNSLALILDFHAEPLPETLVEGVLVVNNYGDSFLIVFRTHSFGVDASINLYVNPLLVEDVRSINRALIREVSFSGTRQYQVNLLRSFD